MRAKAALRSDHVKVFELIVRKRFPVRQYVSCVTHFPYDPSEIPVHFFGETQISAKECLKKKNKYRLICFMIFHLLEQAKSEVGRYTVEKSIRYD